VKSKIFLGILIGIVMFLFWGINFSKVYRSDIDFDWIELVKIIDGDTIEVKIENKIESVRLIGIDAPEIEEKTKEKGLESKKYLEELIKNKKIRLENDKTQEDRDIYHRLLRYVFTEDGILINKEMIKSRMAKEYTFKIPYKYQKEFRELR